MVIRDNGKSLFILVSYAISSFHSRGVSQIAPAISLCSNARDMSKWMAFLQRQGRNLQGNQLIKKDTLKQSWMGNIRVRDAMYKSAMKKPQTEETLDYTQYAMAWFVGAYRGL